MMTNEPKRRRAKKRRLRKRRALEAMKKASIASEFNPREYWEYRYKGGRGSGKGSRGDEVDAKARCVNAILSALDVHSVVDWGCGDGYLLDLLDLEGIRYVGVDVSPTALALCRKRCPEHQYVLWDDYAALTLRADLAMSIDVLQHFPRDKDYYEYLNRVLDSATRYVLIHNTNYDLPRDKHMRHRKIMSDIPKQWELISTTPGVNSGDFFILERT